MFYRVNECTVEKTPSREFSASHAKRRLPRALSRRRRRRRRCAAREREESKPPLGPPPPPPLRRPPPPRSDCDGRLRPCSDGRLRPRCDGLRPALTASCATVPSDLRASEDSKNRRI